MKESVNVPGHTNLIKYNIKEVVENTIDTASTRE